MKRLKPFVFMAALAGVWLLGSSDMPYAPYDGYEPYFMERSELERSVSYADLPRDMENPGKLWLGAGGSEIYVVERYKGVHIIDNSDPTTPRQAKFIIAPGCMDVAVKENIIYIDNAVDLVAFNLDTGLVTKRIKDYFPAPASPTGEYYYNDSDMILVGWRKIENSK